MRVNALLADEVIALIKENDIIWVHDYHHLLPFASELRKHWREQPNWFFTVFHSRRRFLTLLPPHDELLEQLVG